MDKIDTSDWLIDSLTKEIATFIVEDEKIEYDEALKKLYESDIFEKLSDSGTGLYREGAAYVYQYYLEEQREKHWKQQNILKRTDIPFKPLKMDKAILQKYNAQTKPLTVEDKKRIDKMLMQSDFTEYA